jgi:uroporphyrinogen-III synthase
MLSRASSEMVARPLELGEQTDEVLAEYGFTADKIGTSKQNKVVESLTLIQPTTFCREDHRTQS